MGGERVKTGASGRTRDTGLVEDSPLRSVDPRTKLALSLCASLAVMLPLERLAVFVAFYALLLLWARLLREAARQIWRLKWVLLTLFVLDWLLVGPHLAVIVTLRIVLLAGAFALLVRTTTPGEFRLALEWFRLPYRYAFSVSLAFQSVSLLEAEWRNIREAQRARGAWSFEWAGWRQLVSQVRELVALTVPAVVLATKRAWTLTEAAYARGFDSPRRRPYRRLTMGGLDWLLLTTAAATTIMIVTWRGFRWPVG
jgi:energy-coupling factor transporter transmembrane protein EcfT